MFVAWARIIDICGLEEEDKEVEGINRSMGPGGNVETDKKVMS